jgi:hypothetical protein
MLTPDIRRDPTEHVGVNDELGTVERSYDGAHARSVLGP